MTRFTIKFNDDEARALYRAAWATRREPREFVAYVMRRWLTRRGYLDDPTGGGQSARREEDNTRPRAELGNLARERVQ